MVTEIDDSEPTFEAIHEWFCALPTNSLAICPVSGHRKCWEKVCDCGDKILLCRPLAAWKKEHFNCRETSNKG